MAEKYKCPLKYLSDTFGSKWKLPIICILSDGETPKRYSTIKRRLTDITNAMLAKSLRELEDSGLVFRKQYNEIPPRVEYSLTEKGKGTLDFLAQAAQWAINDMKKEGIKIFCDECMKME